MIFALLVCGLLVFGEGAPSASSLGEQGALVRQPLKTVQVISFIRHGVATGEDELYDTEWDQYNINLDLGEGLLTPLGFAQCWSLGANLKLSHPELFDEILTSHNYEINIGPKSKSSQCSQYIWEGIKGNLPFIGHFKESNIRAAFIEHGNCHHCSEASFFPFDLSQSLTTEDRPQDKLNFELHSTDLIDYDNYCLDLLDSYREQEDLMSEEDLNYLKSLSPDKEISEVFYLMYVGKHIYHNLEALDISKELYDKALATVSSQQRELTRVYTTPTEINWAFQAIFGRNLMRDLLGKIGNENKWISYIMHGNNMISMITLLIGYNKDPELYDYGFASTLDLVVLQDQETGEQFVRMVKDGLTMQMRSCQNKDCTIQEFMALIKECTELGGDLDTLCGV